MDVRPARRILGIETSSRRGSVALVEDGRPVVSLTHEEPNAHAERTLPLIERALEAAAWTRESLDRVAVGLGPGSFTGLRIGIALAQGIALGLGVPLVGVGSLRAMAAAVPPEHPQLRIALLDARRGEVFAAAYDVAGLERLAPCTLPWSTALVGIEAQLPEARLLVGEAAAALAASPAGIHRSPASDLPHATWVAIVGASLDPPAGGVEPLYVRPVDAVRPKLPPFPL